MKKIPLVAFAAIALGALAWSCSDSAAPTTPLDLDAPAFHHASDHDKGGGGNGGGGGGNGGGGDKGGSTTVALTNAMATSDPADHPVKGKENKRSISYNTDQKAIEGSATLTLAFTPAETCRVEGAGAELADELEAVVTGATIEINYDKTAAGEASDRHGVTAHYTNADGESIRIGLPPHLLPTASIVENDDNTATITYTGGTVRVWRVNDDAKLFCPNDDDVVASLTR